MAEEFHETLADRLIREAMEAGDFDDLPGEGKPIPGAGTPDDEYWWVRGWIRRDRARSADADLQGSNNAR